MAKVVHFEIPADDTKRAVDFYRAAFGWQIRTWEGPTEYWLAETGPEEENGIHGAITKRDGLNSSIVNTIAVESLADAVARIKAAGGTVLEDNLNIPGVGLLAYFKDTEGNILSALQPVMPPS